MRRRLFAAATALAVAVPSFAAEPAPPPRPVPAPAAEAPAEAARSVAFRVRVVTMHNELPAGITLRPGGTVVTEKQVTRLLEAAQLDRRGGVLAAPTVTTAEGQTATVQTGYTRTFTTGVEAGLKDGQVVLTPTTRKVEVGTRFEVVGRVKADETTVAARLKYTDTRVGDTVPAVPVNLPPPRVGVLVLEAPQVDTATVDAAVELPAGRAVVIAGPTRMMEVREEYGTPVLSSIPYVSRLFTNVGVGRLAVRTFLVVSAVIDDEPAVPVAPPPRAAGR